MVIDREQLRQYVQNGALLLDRQEKLYIRLLNWRAKIQAQRELLDMQYGDRDVLAILFGTYLNGYEALGLSYQETQICGFNIDPPYNILALAEKLDYNNRYFTLLTELWIAETANQRLYYTQREGSLCIYLNNRRNAIHTVAKSGENEDPSELLKTIQKGIPTYLEPDTFFQFAKTRTGEAPWL